MTISDNNMAAKAPNAEPEIHLSEEIPMFDQAGNRIDTSKITPQEKTATIVTLPATNSIVPITTLPASNDPLAPLPPQGTGAGMPAGTIPSGSALEIVHPGTVVRRSHKCCGGCCDCRRAVIVVNSVMIGLSATALIYLSSILNLDEETVPDQYLLDAVKRNATYVLISLVIGVVLFISGIVGAVRFNICLITLPLIWYCADIVLSLWTRNFVDGLVSIFFAYPHVILIREIKSGIMTKYTYPIEQHSCCCV